MIYITGDTHGGFHRFTTSNFPQQKQMDHNDYVIITGDFGGVWDGSGEELYWLDWLNERPFTTLFLDGNHENFDMLNALPQKIWHGGRVHEVRPNVLHLMRGQVFEIDEAAFFTMGGGASHDIQDGILNPASPNFKQEYRFKRKTQQMFRVKGVSWWPEELPTDVEYEEAVKNLDRIGWRVDCILTHCAPTSIVKKLGKGYDPDQLTDFLESIRQRCRFDYWFMGHYHRNQLIDDRFIIQWEQMVELRWE